VTSHTCRNCDEELRTVFADLGMSPLANSYVPADRLHAMEPYYPLTAFVCDSCWLVQVPPVVAPDEIFREYAYFSSWSQSWLSHCQDYVERMIPKLGLDDQSYVVEVASNDGYLLRYFAERGTEVLGIEPAENVARAATAQGIRTRVDFFSSGLATELAQTRRADLIVANNVLAHVPELNDFVAGLSILLAEGGTITVEVPHLLQLIRGLEFDTIYHEHVFYFSLLAVDKVVRAHNLVIEDVEEIPTHGGSLRIYLRHAGDAAPKIAVTHLLDAERNAGLDRLDTYAKFDLDVRTEKRRILQTLVPLLDAGAEIAGYGAPAKGNTLLNYCGIGRDMVRFTVDVNPEKQGRFLPGTRIAVLHPDAIREHKPDYVFILPWNLRAEIEKELHYVSDWGAKFLVRGSGLEIVEP